MGETPEAASQPVLALIPASLSFGDAAQGEALTRTVSLENRGSTPVRIERVATGCGCAVIAPEDHELMPGEATDLVVNLRTSNLRGVIRKAASVYVVGEPDPPVRLPITANVQPDVEVLPASLVHEPAMLRELSPMHLDLRRPDGEELVVASVTTPDPHLRGELVRGDDPSHAAVVVTVSPDAPLGWSITGDLVVKVGGHRPHEIRVPVCLRRSAGIVLAPADRLVFPPVQPTEEATATVSIRVRPEVERLRDVHATVMVRGPGGTSTHEAEVREMDHGRQYEVVVALPAFPSVGVFSGTLTVHGQSDGPWREELLIWGTVRSDESQFLANRQESIP